LSARPDRFNGSAPNRNAGAATTDDGHIDIHQILRSAGPPSTVAITEQAVDTG
jgi:hypothetical protein